MRIGIISDTHGLLRPEVHDVFKEVDLIWHAGDVGTKDVLDELALIAPVTAVYGNVDEGSLRLRLQEIARDAIDGFRFVMAHGHELGSPTPELMKEGWPDADVLIFGHTHQAIIHNFADFSVALNPGSAGPRRFRDPVTVAIMETEPGIPPRARIVHLIK